MLGRIEVMRRIIVSVLHGLFSSFRTRMELQLEVAALRHQVEVLRRDQRSRVRLTGWTEPFGFCSIVFGLAAWTPW